MRTTPAGSSASRSSSSRPAASLLGLFPVTVIALHRSGQRTAARVVDRQRDRQQLAAARAHQRRPLELQPADRAAGDRRHRAADDADGPSALPRPRAHGAAVGLRLPRADGTDAGHRRRLRTADPAGVRDVFPHRAALALAVRHESELRHESRGPLVALAVPADRPRRPSSWRGSSARSSRGASRCTSRTASSRCSRCCSWSDDAVRLPLPTAAAGHRARAGAAARRLGQPVPRLAAEQVGAIAVAAVPDDPQAVPQGRRRGGTTRRRCSG